MNIGGRMKYYENAYRYYLPTKLPIIIRLDMRAGHTYTKKLAKPYDGIFHYVMIETTKALCREIQGAEMAYTQSDEISILIPNEAPQPYFDNNLQKIVSITAAQASVTFQNVMRETIENYNCYTERERDMFRDIYCSTLNKVMFDSRAFALPPNEIMNYFFWRQFDCRRNSISALAREYFSQKELKNKNCEEMLSMLRQKDIEWWTLYDWKKLGSCITKQEVEVPICYNGVMKTVTRHVWQEDTPTPVFAIHCEECDIL